MSDLGRVRSFHNPYGRILKPIVSSHGYAQVTLAKNGTMRSRHIHMLVAKAFIPNPENKPQVNHIDGNTMNSRVELQKL